MKAKQDYEPIAQPGGGRCSLSIYPPGTWFDNTQFVVFVGGCGVAKRRTLAAAEKTLLAAAIAETDDRIKAAKTMLSHYVHQRELLLERGIGKPTARPDKSHA